MTLKNISFDTERLVEIHHANEFFNKYNGDILEIGAVLHGWENFLNEMYKTSNSYKSHRIVDVSERAPFIENKDALIVDYNDKNVICISTIEHTGFVDIYNDFEFGNINRNNPMILLDKITTESRNFLITWPIGYCKDLDRYFYNNKDKYNYILYTTLGDGTNIWNPTNIDERTFYNIEYIIGDRFSKPNGVLILIGNKDEI